MIGLKAALWMEILKVRRTKIFPVSIYFFIFIGIMMGMLMFLSMHPEIANRSSTVNMKTSLLGGSDWNSFFGLLRSSSCSSDETPGRHPLASAGYT